MVRWSWWLYDHDDMVIDDIGDMIIDGDYMVMIIDDGDYILIDDDTWLHDNWWWLYDSDDDDNNYYYIKHSAQDLACKKYSKLIFGSVFFILFF